MRAVRGCRLRAATITQSGNRLNVNQASDRAILNWSTFNIGANAAVSFAQPNSGSVAPAARTGTSTSNGGG